MAGSVDTPRLIVPQKVQPLLEIIQSSSVVDDGLTACGVQFCSLFQSRAERFKACCWLTSLLAKSVLKSVNQRIIALYLLQCDYACAAKSLPFLPVFLQVCNPVLPTPYCTDVFIGVVVA